MEYRLLGPLEVLRDGEPVEVGRYKLRALLALLLVHADQVVSTDRLIDEIWGADSGGDRQNSLWVSISGLRSALEPDRKKRTDGTILLTRSPGYLLATADADVDARRFEQLAVEGRALLDPDPAAASLVLQEALSMWRGHALEEFTYEPWAQAEIARLEELRLTAVEDRILADLRVGRARELVGELESLVRQHPLRERLTGHLMLALYRTGRQAEALRAFGALRGRLGDELGIEPSAELARLEERIVLDDPDLSTPAIAADPGVAGLTVRGYELRDRLGESDTGYVYRAYQPSVGREVAVTVIRPELANDPDFIRRFEGEAQVVSQLEHPRIVPLYDYWREPDAAYLVTRRYELGNLADALAAGSLPTEIAVRILEQVGGALAAAHRRGIVHGDVSPRSILLDSEHNAHLTGFGLPATGDEFSAPELRGRGAASPRTDVFSLATVAADVLRRATGERDAPLVGPAATVIGRATAPDPADRHDDVELFVRELSAAIGGVPVAATPVENPYHGLRAFDEGDAGTFFGRERLVERLVARLGHAGPQGRLIALVGPSGAGKSSVVRAGLIPAIRSGALPSSDRWFVVTMTPGQHPFEALEDALLRVAVDPPASVLERLLDRGIGDTVSAILPEEGTQLLLVVDQLEELFSHASQQATERFLAALAETAADAHAPVKVVATLRADFYDHPLRHGAFGEMLRLGTEVITPMTAQELEQAVAGPAAGVGVDFERGLVSQIVADMQGQAAALPLLQYALTELFDARRGTTIPASAYDELGGVSAALVRRADGIHAGLDDAGRRAARDVFLRLVSLGEGAEDTRRRALLSELTDGGGHAVTDVIDTFGRHRLLSFDRDPTTRGPTVELAHEALITEWAQLREWIADARSDVRAQRRLATAATEWREREHDAGFLLTGPRLARYADWDHTPPVRLTHGEGQFLAASNDAAEAERDVERQRVRRLRRIVAIATAALLIAVVAGVFAFRQSQRANDEADAAEASAEQAQLSADAAQLAADEADLATLIARSAAFSLDNPDVSLLLALEARRRAPGAETDQAVLDALWRSPIGNRLATVTLLSEEADDDACPPRFVSLDGSTEYVTVGDSMQSKHLLSGVVTDHGPAPTQCAAWLADPATNRKLAGSLDATRYSFGPADGDWETEVTLDEPMTLLSREIVGNRVFVVGGFQEAATVALLDATTGEFVGEPATDVFFPWGPQAISRDGAYAAFGEATPGREGPGGLVHIRDAQAGEELHRVPISWPAMRLAFDDATGQLIAATDTGRLVTIDPASGEVVADVATDATTDFVAIGVRPDGMVVIVSFGAVEVVDRFSGRSVARLELQDVVDGRVGRDGTVLALDTRRRGAVYDLSGTALVERSYPTNSIAMVQAGPGEAWFAAPREGGAVRIDLADGERTTHEFTNPDGSPFLPIGVYPDADGLWVIDEFLTFARIVDGVVAETARPPGDGDLRPRGGLGMARDGSFLGARDGRLEAYRIDTSPGSLGVTLTVVNRDAESVAPAADGGLHIMTESGTLRSYDAAALVTGEIETGLIGASVAVSDSATGRIAFGGPFGVAIFDPGAGTVEPLADTRAARGLGFVRNGELLVIVGGDGDVRLWDVDRNASAGFVWDGTGGGPPAAPWYDEESESVWVATSGSLIEIPLSPEKWVERACELVGRDLTQDEWDRFVPGGGTVQRVCT